MLQGGGRSGESIIEIDLTKETDAFFAGHTIDGRVLFPATGYLVCVVYYYLISHCMKFDFNVVLIPMVI